LTKALGDGDIHKADAILRQVEGYQVKLAKETPASLGKGADQEPSLPRRKKEIDMER